MDKEAAPWIEAGGGKLDVRPIAAAVLVGVGYYFGTMVGFALTFQPKPISILWPPNSILLGALLLTPANWWWLLLLCALPAHLAAQMQSGVPATMLMGWFISNCSEALIGAAAVRKFIPERLRFDSIRHVSLFLFLCAFLAPFLSSFLDVAFVRLADWGQGSYWQLWRMRFFSNVLAILAFVPVLLTCNRNNLASMRKAPFLRRLESCLWACALLAISFVVFISEYEGNKIPPLILYAPLPILFWAAVQFNSFTVCLSFLAITCLAIWGAVQGHGPFVASSPADNALSIQLFLIGVAVPLLLLSAAVQERRRAQEALHRKQEKLKLALAAARMSTWDWDIQESKGMEPHESECLPNSGNSDSDGDGDANLKSFSRSLHPDDRMATMQAITRAAREDAPYEGEFRIVQPNGAIRWMLGKGAVLHDEVHCPVRMLGVNVDITDRKHAEATAREEAALRESEARFRQMANSMPQIVWAARPDGHVDYANRRWQELTGLKETQTGDESWLPFVHPDDRQRAADRWRAAMQSGQMYQVECRVLIPRSSEYRWYLARALPARDETGNIVRWYGTSTDIDDQKKAEHALYEMREDLERRVEERTAELCRANAILKAEIEERRKAEEAERISEARFARVFRLSPDAMSISCGVEGRIVDVNDRWENLFGYQREEVIGMTVRQLGLYANEKDFLAVLERSRACGCIRNLEVEIIDKSKTVRQTIFSGEAINDGGEPCFIAIIRDITEQRQAKVEAQQQRKQLAHLSRAVVVGELSGALAHELNQPLTAILTNAQAAQRFMTRSPVNLEEISDILGDIVDADKRAGEVIRRLRALFMKGEPTLQLLDLNEVVHEALDLAHSDLIRRKITVTLKLASGLGPIYGDRVQLQQVFLNLIVNACEAMNGNTPDRCRLTFSSGSIANGNALIDVSDTGHGIAADTIDRLFDSFFTTKVHGLGFGLSISRAIVAEHGGRIEAINNPGGGATFRITLPTQLRGLS